MSITHLRRINNRWPSRICLMITYWKRGLNHNKWYFIRIMKMWMVYIKYVSILEFKQLSFAYVSDRNTYLPDLEKDNNSKKIVITIRFQIKFYPSIMKCPGSVKTFKVAVCISQRLKSTCECKRTHFKTKRVCDVYCFHRL